MEIAYSYYIGKLYSSEGIKKDTWIKPDGTYESLEGMYASPLFGLQSSYIYFDKRITSADDPNELAYLYLYDSTKSLVTRKLISSLWADSSEDIINIHNISDDIAYIAFTCFPQENKPFIDYTIDNSGFIYNVFKVSPNFKTLSKKYSKENNQVFFRNSLEGKLTLGAQDFSKFSTFTIDDSLIFLLMRLRDSRDEELYYKAAFNKTDCVIDYSKRTAELKFKPLDSYTDILNKYEDTYDLISLAPELTKINVNKRPLVQVYVAGSNTVSNFIGGTSFETEVLEPINDIAEIQSKYYFDYNKTVSEVYISGASITGVNGVYAGVSDEDPVWANKNGYELAVELYSGVQYYIVIRDSSGTVIYRSTDTVGFISLADKYIGTGFVGYMFANVNRPLDACVVDTVFTYFICSRLLCDVDTVSGIATYDLPADDFVTVRQNYKKCIGLADVGSTFGRYLATAKTSNTPTKYGRNDYGEYFTSEFDWLYTTYTRPLPVCRNSWVNVSIWYTYSDMNVYKLFDENTRKQYTIKDCFSIAAVIKVLLSKIAPAITHEATSEYSQFLYGENPVITNERFYVYITPKSNILKGSYDQAAQKAETTFKNIMDMLSTCFRCYWFIEGNKLKIEHISYFNNGRSYTDDAQTQFDFTAKRDIFNKNRVSYFQNAVEFNKSDLASRYEFAWMDDVTEFFGGITVNINDNFLEKDKTDSIVASNFTSDIDYMLLEPDNFSSDGFALLCPTINSAGDLELPITRDVLQVDELNRSLNTYTQNYYASWPYLLNFYTYDMPGFKAKPSCYEKLDIRAIRRCMEHEIELFFANDPDLLRTIVTHFGAGVIEEVSVNILTRKAKIKLLYAPK